MSNRIPEWRENTGFPPYVPDPEQYVLTPEDELISDPAEETATTRKVIRPQFFAENSKDPLARLDVKLLHQRRGSLDAKSGRPWLDIEAVPLSKVLKDEKVALPLSGRETKRLFQALMRLYKRRGDLKAIASELDLVVSEPDETLIVSGKERELLVRWLDEEGEGFFEHVEELRPGMFDTVMLRRDYQKKQAALTEFHDALVHNQWIENDWEQYFRRNRWIFGYGLSYHFLTKVQDQPHYGGTEVTGRGAQRGDVLMRTEADARFTVLVELKKPDTPLLVQGPYRGESIFRVFEEVAGGVAQLQANCATWFGDGSRDPKWIVDHQVKQSEHTHQPKGILIVGHTKSLRGDAGMIGSFERFRRGLQNPEILTFDELYQRAQHLLRIESEEEETGI